MKYSRDIKYAVSAFIIIFFEATLGKYISISGALPMLTFAYIIVCALMESDMSYIIVLSIILGAFSDILYSLSFGIYTVSYCLAAYYTFKLKDSIFSSKWLFLIIDSFVLCTIQQFCYMIIHISDIGVNYFWRGFFFRGLPSALYTTVISCLFYFIGSRVFRKRR